MYEIYIVEKSLSIGPVLSVFTKIISAILLSRVSPCVRFVSEERDSTNTKPYSRFRRLLTASQKLRY